MRYSLRQAACIFIFSFAGYSGSARAAQVIVTITGSVLSGTDSTGVFGPANTNLANQPFRLVFTFDDTKGTAKSQTCPDGTIEDSAVYGMDASNPGTAVLQIGGRSFPLGGGIMNQNYIFSYASRVGAIDCAGNPYRAGVAGYGIEVRYGGNGSTYGGYVTVGSPSSLTYPSTFPAAGTILSTSGVWQTAIASAPLDTSASDALSFNIGIYGPTNLIASGYLSQQFLTVSGPLPANLQFVPVTPCRVADTRNPYGAFGGPEISANGSRSFLVPGSPCNIPSVAAAYSLNVTAVPDAQLGYLTIWPTGEPQPVVSTLNSDGRIKANAAIVPAGANGGVSIYATDPTQVIIDVDGYFLPAGNSNSALAFYPISPCRVVDTRKAPSPLRGPWLSGGQARTFPMLASACNLPSTAQAYSLNFTAVPHSKLGYLTTWPAGQAQPLVSTLNASTGTVTANAAIVPAGTNGDIAVYSSDDTDLVIDINGYFAPPGAGGLSLYALVPCRVLDTRNPPGSPPPSGVLRVNVPASGCGAPLSAQGFVFNSTVVPSAGLGYLTLWPDGQTQPFVSTLNSLDGAINSNLAIVPTSNGSIDAFVSDPAHLILDLFGYFAP